MQLLHERHRLKHRPQFPTDLTRWTGAKWKDRSFDDIFDILHKTSLSVNVLLGYRIHIFLNTFFTSVCQIWPSLSQMEGSGLATNINYSFSFDSKTHGYSHNYLYVELVFVVFVLPLCFQLKMEAMDWDNFWMVPWLLKREKYFFTYIHVQIA